MYYVVRCAAWYEVNLVKVLHNVNLGLGPRHTVQLYTCTIHTVVDLTKPLVSLMHAVSPAGFRRLAKASQQSVQKRRIGILAR